MNADDIGLPAGSHPGRRRTPRLRREEVAELSGVGVTWYRHPQAGMITLEMFQLRLEDDPGLLMVVQVPADPASHDRVAALLALP